MKFKIELFSILVFEAVKFVCRLGLDTLLFHMWIFVLWLLVVMVFKIKKFGGILVCSEEPVF